MTAKREEFLSGVELRPIKLAGSQDIVPLGLAIGKGSQGAEVVVVHSDRRPTATDLRRTWTSRNGGRAAPLLLVVLHDGKATVCGPAGDPPPLYRDLVEAQAESICRSVLDAPDRHAALRFLRDVLPEAESAIPGLRNSGLLATHELKVGVPRRSDWSRANAEGQQLLPQAGRLLLQDMGYELEPLTGPAHILRARGSRQAVAVLLEREEDFDLKSRRFSGLSPVSYALAQAEEHRLPWVIVVQDQTLRLHPVGTGVGVAARGRTETYLQLRINLLREDQAGYLWLLFSPDALREGGTLEAILASSEVYAADLGGRLRQRIYDDVVPDLAEAIAAARDLDAPGQQELAQTYEMALLLLFRLLFVAYAEDQRLLPYETNERYKRRSLKEKARELQRLVSTGESFDEGATHWREVMAVFEAIRDGNREWGVPQYNGTLFSIDPDLSSAGAALEDVELSNRQFGPALAKLLLDEGPEGLGPIDFRSLGVREFGTIYEGLLKAELSVADRPLTVDKDENYVPASAGEDVLVREGEIYLHDASGRRKSSGTYYTKTFAVDHLLSHALEPALQQHLQELDDLDDAGATEAFFDFRVADISMGSGHFLTAALDRIERGFSDYLARRPLPGVHNELERLRQKARENLLGGESAVEIEDAQLLRRQIARRCIYGVDINPIAVHLARLAVWIHTFVPGLPLSFLDHGLVQGNSLLGIATLKEAHDALGLLEEQIPEWAPQARDLFQRAQAAVERLGRLSDADATEIREAREAQREIEEREAPYRALFDILTAARIDTNLQQGLAQGVVLQWGRDLSTLVDSPHHRQALEVLKPLKPFHFPVQFPEVFRGDRLGFDVLVGNPPWEKTQVEEHEFLCRYHPGYKSLTQREQKKFKGQFLEARPQLLEKLRDERRMAEVMRGVLTSGAYPGMGESHPDLYKAFCWRFWWLARPDGGWIGVVLPRSAFAAKGSEEFRKALLENDEISDLTLLVNSRHWVFEDVHPQYTVGLLSLRRNVPKAERILSLHGPFHSQDEFVYGVEQPPVRFVAEKVKAWNDTAALPLLPAEESARVFAKMREAPRLDTDDGRSWRVRPYQELNSTTDKKYFELVEEPEDGYWPVYKGGSLDLWVPDTGVYYAWAEPASVLKRLQAKREWGANRSDSPFHEFPKAWSQDPATLPCYRARLAFRRISRATDTRTVRIALIPPNVVAVDTAAVMLWPRGDERDEAYLLGVMSSRPYDWYMRRFVETHVDWHVLNPSPVPRPPRTDALWVRTVEIAGELATPDSRFSEWAKAVGASVEVLSESERVSLVAELDSVAAHLFGLSEQQLRHVFETFQEGWDYEPSLERTLAHFRRWKDAL